VAAVAACSHRDDGRYASPAQTWQTYAAAVDSGHVDKSWACFSRSYRDHEFGGDAAAWAARIQAMDAVEKRGYKRFEIAEERVINQRLAYLLFDPGTLTPGHPSPFAYFLREDAGWKLTAHLDTVFHRELEGAIERGEYRLPAPP
jgi:hypothetical protein